MIYLGKKSWKFTPDNSKEELSGVNVFLGKEIDKEKGTGYEALKKKCDKDFDFSSLENVAVLDEINVFFNEYGSIQLIGKSK